MGKGESDCVGTAHHRIWNQLWLWILQPRPRYDEGGVEGDGDGGIYHGYAAFVLLDIWGTWCGPCKDALSHSTEEYARLKDYDIEFLYLANQSPQESWENVIKEYNVSGDNVAHYNLPALQQSAIERHLDVHSFPTYKLFNRDGHLLDLEVDARDLDQLIQLLEQLK